MDKVNTLKSEIRLWEKKFIKKNGRKPLKSDIANDKTIVKKYEKYKKLKKNLENQHSVSIEEKNKSSHHHSITKKSHSDNEEDHLSSKKQQQHSSQNKKALTRSKSLNQIPNGKSSHHTKTDKKTGNSRKTNQSSNKSKVLVVKSPNEAFSSFSPNKKNTGYNHSKKKKNNFNSDSESDSSSNDFDEDSNIESSTQTLTEDEKLSEEEEEEEVEEVEFLNEKQDRPKIKKSWTVKEKNSHSESDSSHSSSDDDDNDLGSETEVQDMDSEEIEEEIIESHHRHRHHSDTESSEDEEDEDDEDDESWSDEDEDSSHKLNQKKRNKTRIKNKTKSLKKSNSKLNKDQLKSNHKTKEGYSSKQKNSKQNTSANTLVDKHINKKDGITTKKKNNNKSAKRKSKNDEEEQQSNEPRVLDIINITPEDIYNRTPVTGVLRLRIVRQYETLVDRIYPRFALYNLSNGPTGLQIMKRNKNSLPLPPPILLARRRKKCSKPNYIISRNTDQTVRKTKENYVATLRYCKEHSLYMLLDSRKYNPKLPNKGLKTSSLIRFTNLTNHNVFVATPGLFYDTTKPIPDILNDVDFENEDNLFFLNSNPGPTRPRINSGKFGSKKFDINKPCNKYRNLNFTETSGEFFFSNYHQRKYNPELSINDNNQPKPILFSFEQMNSTDYTVDVMHPLTPLEGFSIALSIISEMIENKN